MAGTSNGNPKEKRGEKVNNKNDPNNIEVDIVDDSEVVKNEKIVIVNTNVVAGRRSSAEDTNMERFVVSGVGILVVQETSLDDTKI